MSAVVGAIAPACSRPHSRVVRTTIPLDIVFAYRDTSRDLRVTAAEFAVLARGFRHERDRPMRDEIVFRLTPEGGEVKTSSGEAALASCVRKGFIAMERAQCVDLAVRPVYRRTYKSKYVEVLDCTALNAFTIPFALFVAMQVSPTKRSGEYRSHYEWGEFLGVSRESICRAFKKLQSLGLIETPESSRPKVQAWRVRIDLQVEEPRPFLRVVVDRSPVREVTKTVEGREWLKQKRGQEFAQLTVSPVPEQEQSVALPPLFKPAVDLAKINAAMSVSAPPAVPAPSGEVVRRAVRTTYNDWRAVPVSLDTLPIEQAAKIVLGRFTTLSSYLAQKPVALQAKHLAATTEVLMWLQSLDPASVDDDRTVHLKQWVGGTPFAYAFNAVGALFSAAFSGFTYEPTVIFQAGTHGYFDRFAIDALRKLELKQGLSGTSKNPKCSGKSLAEVEQKLTTELQALGVAVGPTLPGVSGQTFEDKVKALAQFAASIGKP